ncbi:uncharacterized protein BDV17DRAFT_137654 [Aspergillus undulatus]|uniref:uncharacterized protein n=1 Tax=Aspergillus undulatus TaxID=1810928 RepID=UPI003CCD6D38
MRVIRFRRRHLHHQNFIGSRNNIFYHSATRLSPSKYLVYAWPTYLPARFIIWDISDLNVSDTSRFRSSASDLMPPESRLFDILDSDNQLLREVWAPSLGPYTIEVLFASAIWLFGDLELKQTNWPLGYIYIFSSRHEEDRLSTSIPLTFPSKSFLLDTIIPRSSKLSEVPNSREQAVASKISNSTVEYNPLVSG